MSHWSGKRDSNPRPLPWQGNALPTELFPRFVKKVPEMLNLSNKDLRIVMLYFIEGLVQDVQDQMIIVSVGGWGVQVAVPDSSLFKRNEHYKIPTYMHWSAEQGPQLFGFAYEQDKLAFMHIISCNGIGPKIGLAVLKHMPATVFFSSILTNDVKALSAVNGIGAKKAETIILHLKDKINKLLNQGIIAPLNAHSSTLNDVSQALTALHYTRPEIQRALDLVAKNMHDSTSFEDVMRKALVALAQRRV